MLVKSDRGIHYPITVTTLFHKVDAEVKKHEPIFSYTYSTKVDEWDQYGESRQVSKSYLVNYDSPTEGTITGWKIRKGAVIEKPGSPLVEITEACAHDVQFGGLCVNCGKDMGLIDYGTTAPDSTRAGVSVAHSNAALKVSENEARRLDKDLKTRLLDSRKLLLVVDLDQTIIHATVDPTVDEWQNDTSNPNYEAVKDVEKFQLKEETPGYDCWYYVKMRPHLKDFLREMSELFEMHIYTMGTRAYAKEIAHIVDENKRVFGDRILAREDNQDMTRKSLANLFPVDTKMAVIIDDRGDVWQWSDHLIKVVPFDFFKGIGDINASFLPKRQDLPPPPPPPELPSEKPATVSDPPSSETLPNGAKKRKLSDRAEKPSQPKTEQSDDTASTSSTVGDMLPMAANDASMEEQSSEHDEQLKAQIVDQPLRKMQREIEQEEEDLATQTTTADTQSTESTEVASESPRPRHKLLQDDDVELENLRRALKEVHGAFYSRYWKEVESRFDSARATKLKRRNTSSNAQPDPSRGRVPEHDLDLVPNMRDIMTETKLQVLRGCNIVFSGVIPLYSDPKNYENNDLWRWAASFGASVSLDLTKNTTHVVGSKDRYTGKMRAAARNPNIKIVSLDWLSKACREWKKPEEEDFLIPVEPSKRRNGYGANGKSPTSHASEAEDTGSESDLTGLAEDDDDEENGQQGHHPSIGDMEEDEWSKMHEMFDSDDDEEEEEDGDNESETVSQSDDARKKRKRDDVSDTESIASKSSSANGVLRRKRRIAGRASSLNQVTTLADIEGQEEQPSTASQPEHKAGKRPTEAPAEEEEDDDWGDFDNFLEEAIAQDDAEKAEKAEKAKTSS